LGRNDFPACKAYHTNLAVVGTDGFDMSTLDEVGRKGVERGNRFLTTGVAYADLHGSVEPATCWYQVLTRMGQPADFDH
jgi:hypothetical protein